MISDRSSMLHPICDPIPVVIKSSYTTAKHLIRSTQHHARFIRHGLFH